MSVTQHDQQLIKLEPITRGDLELLLAWRSLLPPNATRSDAVPTWEQHLAWFQCETHKDYIIWFQGRRVGVVGFNYSNYEPWISIHIAESGIRTKGIGFEAVRYVIEMLKAGGEPSCFARVHYQNIPSHLLFTKLGFVPVNISSDWHLWKKDLNGT